MSARWRIAGGFLICQALFLFFSNFLHSVHETLYYLVYFYERIRELKHRENDRVIEEDGLKPPKRKIVILGKRIPMPQSIAMRRTLGGSLVVGGALGFLPILGFWMLPLGLIVLSNDSHRVRRWRRKSEVHIWRKWLKRGSTPTAT